MTEMGHRSNLELVKEIAEYLDEKRGVVTQSQLCSAVGINSKTAKMWLEIFHLVQNQCPYFQLGKAGRSHIISVYGLNQIGGHPEGALRKDWPSAPIGPMSSTLKAALAEKSNEGIFPLKTELNQKLTEGMGGLEHVIDRNEDVPKLFPVPQGAKVKCPECGATKDIPSSLRESEEWLRGSLPGGELEEFLCCDRCGKRMQRLIEANPTLAPLLKAKLKCAECGEILELADSMGEGETIVVPIHCSRPMRVIITKE
ncbi:MAG: hypothetical protein ACXAB4_01725 [Candidatus Hodarchaeales archaeon]|jgi:uncharacterized protein (DUF983 family)